MVWMAGRTACVLVAVLLIFASTAHAQVIEKGGFPIKGQNISGASFSLSCPSRLIARAGESISLSCAATGVSEEGVRYEWHSLSDEGLHLLDASQELTPFFTAPLSGDREYAYRLTATGPDVYASASVTVSVGGVSEETVRAPGLQEECDLLTVPDEPGQGCLEDRGPIPFGFGPEEEFLFPEAPGVPDHPSGPGFDSRTPPRLDCPAAVFLEELETGQIGCHAWDASGDEYLEYSWEPVGSTTRDYLDNPRLIPEDSPHPLVVAPEAPAYETLESFHSGETTFRYRYRLTATSRATGLSSHEEVEVYVSSSRPGVYCPLEVVVQEGETVALDCEGVDPLSFRMDYDEEAASVLWEWEGLWGTSTDPLDATDLSSPLFTAQPGSAGAEYHYIASMTTSASGTPRTARRRVTVRVTPGEESAENAEDIAASPPRLVCGDYSVYTGDPDFQITCEIDFYDAHNISDPEDTWNWSNSPDATFPGDHTERLSSATVRNPVFYVPDSLSAGRELVIYDYEVQVRYCIADLDPWHAPFGPDWVTRSTQVEVRVYDTAKPFDVNCTALYSVYEGANDFPLSCSVANAPDGVDLTYAWAPRGATRNTNRLSDQGILVPTFDVPDEVYGNNPNEQYEYTLTVSGGGSQARADVTVSVLDKPRIAYCGRYAGGVTEYNAVWEGSGDRLQLGCVGGSIVPPDLDFTFKWTTTRGTPAEAINQLSDANTLWPWFSVPDEVDKNTNYSYKLEISAPNAIRYWRDYTVPVRNKRPLKLVCESPVSVYEGAADVDMNCTASRAPSGPRFDYVWTGRNGTVVPGRLSSTTIAKPTFAVPENVAADETYEYTLTVSATNPVESDSVDVTVQVLDKKPLDVACATPSPAYEGSPDFDLDCLVTDAPDGSTILYVWAARGDTPDTDKLSSTTIEDPTFDVPDEVAADETYEYMLTVTAENAEPDSVNVTVTVLNKAPLTLVCTPPDPVYEGSEDIAFECEASGAPAGSAYEYVWTARGDTPDTVLLSGADIASPTFLVPDDIAATTTYEYLLTVSAENAESATAEVAVTVLNRVPLTVVCTPPVPAYEGSGNFDLNCSASGELPGSVIAYEWKARGDTQDTARLVAGTDGPTPTFAVPENVAANTDYEYTLTVTAENADPDSVEVTVTVLNKPLITLVCTDPVPAYEGSPDFVLDCEEATGAPSGSAYDYAWTARGDTPDTALLTGTDGPAPTFAVPDDVDADTDYEYTLEVSAENAEDASFDVTVTVLDRKPLNVACAAPSPAYEGSEDFALACTASGAPSGSEIAYVWTARGDTPDTALLVAGTDGPTPTFAVPDAVDEEETYEYLLTASAANAEDGTAEVTVKVLELGSIALVCASPPLAYEGSEDFALDCSVSGDTGDVDYAYAWTARGDTQDTSLLSASDIASPTFYVPDEVDANETHEYLLTASKETVEDATAEVTVTVLNKEPLSLICTPPAPAYEGSPDFALACSASGAPAGSDYAYVWTARGDTPDTALLSAADVASPMFLVPDDVASTTTYEYLLTARAANAEDASAELTVTVLNHGALAVVCTDPAPVYEGSANFALDCSASGAPSGSTYDYAWTARGDTQDTSLLIAGADGPTPTFDVPDNVASTTRYEYLLTASAANAEDASATVTVTVLNHGALAVVCTDPAPVYEGSENFALDCEASGPSPSSNYTYAWTARGDTPDTSLLSAMDIASPTFLVPDDVAATTRYEYLLTASAANAEDGFAAVTVTVLNRSMLAVTCTDPGSVYEGSEDIMFDCSASGAPAGSDYTYAWTPRGDTQDTALLSAADIASPVFYVPDELEENEMYEYLLTVSATNAEDATAEVTVIVLNRPALAVTCADPGSVYEDSDDIMFDCSASGAPGDNPQYTYAWTAHGDTQDTSLLSAADIASPTFYVPDEVEENETYEYLLTISATNAEDATAEVTVTVLNRPALAVTCADPGSVYEGSEDITLDCSASGAPGDNPQYTYAWTARGDTQDTSLLSAADIASPVFYVPDEVEENETYEYLLTISATNAEDATAEVTVTVLNRPALAVTCADPGSVYEGSDDVAFDCSASGAPGDNPQYTYAWTARGDTQDTSLLSAADIASPVFYVPDELDEDETYEYLLTASAENAEDGSVEVTVMVLDRAVAPPSEPVSPPVEEPPVDTSPPLASSSARAPSDPTALGVTVSASPLRFGVQSSDTEVSLDPMTDGISTYVSGPYYGGRMTLSPGGSEATGENGELDLSIELISPVVLKRADATGASSLVLTPIWSYAESCEQLSSQAIGGLYTEVTLSEDDCRLLRFGGEIDLTDVPSGHYSGNMDLVLRSGEREETHSVEVGVTVVPSKRVITIGPGGVRFSTSRALPVALTEEQNLSIYPDVAFLTEGKPDGIFELSNPSLIPLEVSVSARFGYTEATEQGREVVVEDTLDSHLGDLSEVVDIHPGILVLQPGDKGLIRYGLKEEAHEAMASKGYAAFFDVMSQPRRYADLDRMPEEVTGERTARVTMRVPGLYVPGEGASQLRATLLSVSFVGSVSATFLLETTDHPFVGEVVAYDGDGHELGRTETLVYTRSRVRVPLDRMPGEGAVFLRFAPRGSGRPPLPASVEWNAPRRDIGDAQDKDRTLTPATLVQRP